MRSELFAAKLVLSRPLLGGNVMIGAEYSHTERQDDYVNPEGYVPTSFSKLKEQNISPFLEYSRNTPIGQLSVGGRYEWVNFDYPRLRIYGIPYRRVDDGQDGQRQYAQVFR